MRHMVRTTMSYVSGLLSRRRLPLLGSVFAVVLGVVILLHFDSCSPGSTLRVPWDGTWAETTSAGRLTGDNRIYADKFYMVADSLNRVDPSYPKRKLHLTVSDSKGSSSRVFWILRHSPGNKLRGQLADLDGLNGTPVNDSTMATDIDARHSTIAVEVVDDQQPKYYHPGDEFVVIAKLDSLNSNDVLVSPVMAVWKAMRVTLATPNVPDTGFTYHLVDSLFVNARHPLLGMRMFDSTTWDSSKCVYVDTRKSDVKLHMTRSGERNLGDLKLDPNEASFTLAFGRGVFFDYKYPSQDSYPVFVCLVGGADPDSWNHAWFGDTFPLGTATMPPNTDPLVAYSVTFCDTIWSKVEKWFPEDSYPDDTIRFWAMEEACAWNVLHEIGHQAFNLLDAGNIGNCMMNNLSKLDLYDDRYFCSTCRDKIDKERGKVWQFGGGK